MRKIISLLVITIALTSCTNNKNISEEDKKQIISELNEIEILDQKYAGIPPADLRELHGYKKAWEIFEHQRDSVAIINQQKIKTLFKKYGYLGERKVGQEASTSFWLPIQHADNDVQFQQKMLKAMEKEIKNGSNDKYCYAMLEDRIQVNLNKPQRFGTQLTYNKNGQAIPKNGLLDSTNIDSLRKEYALPAFKEYYNEMTKSHFEMNKQMFLDKGITTPQLYK
ncbi:hypothetical protein SAMN04487910_2459 [Aquimarina amphilecti]|uniref:Type IV secretion system putative lipoprotein virB7 n=1 Tax=Aquimarina amphilecti TaxID=1038014 RepID=A0A1H7Q714_AQUAM|nr:DUF6624 domain-containing protein [Aquimarina amphilecti]SEL43951.1 hypothetical protein SAMN04487910_2459 [Aquimarina amphilecti]